MSKKRKPEPSDDPLLPPEVGHDLGLSHREWTRADHGRKHSADRFEEFGRWEDRTKKRAVIILAVIIFVIAGAWFR